ncbi:PREDICTED: RING finger protein unkempt-like, partial [Rhagoletis zephyria]|uniref:RING finger protein unkempt-like n=1 Tax=Rhagoletis zephyria TaxID=28612 RepID=UPI0008114D9D
YACPQYHNNKDRRRTPKNFNYRSTPCPSVKQGDEWGDPSNCENEEKCQYCHTRTEQQFHPEIYKSTKCNDIQQSNHCPRGPFCAFAHSESCDEIKAAREFSTDPTTDLPPSLSNANHSGGGGGGHKNLANLNNCNNNTSPVDIARANSLSAYSRPNIVQTIPSSLPDHFDIHKYELATQQQLSL